MILPDISHMYANQPIFAVRFGKMQACLWLYRVSMQIGFKTPSLACGNVFIKILFSQLSCDEVSTRNYSCLEWAALLGV